MYICVRVSVLKTLNILVFSNFCYVNSVKINMITQLRTYHTFLETGAGAEAEKHLLLTQFLFYSTGTCSRTLNFPHRFFFNCQCITHLNIKCVIHCKKIQWGKFSGWEQVPIWSKAERRTLAHCWYNKLKGNITNWNGILPVYFVHYISPRYWHSNR